MNAMIVGLTALLLLALQVGFFAPCPASIMPQPDGQFARGAGVQFTLAGSVELDVPYVPTPQPVVDEMLRIASVTRQDILYDLGCGDGRIVVTAAKNMGAHGVGVDIDPERIRESKKNAADNKVTDRVRFIQDDLFNIDFSKATVLTLYLLPSVNLQLRPKILRELKPGTRIVSHQFSMDDWEPDLTTKVMTSSIYYWVVPANVSGTWEIDAVGGILSELSTLDLKQKFQKIEGTFKAGDAQAPLEHMELKGDHIKFTVMREIDGKPTPVRFEGRAKDNVMEGTVEWKEKPGEDTRKWRANRDPSTMTPLDGEVAVQASVPIFPAEQAEIYLRAEKYLRGQGWDWMQPSHILLREHLDGL